MKTTVPKTIVANLALYAITISLLASTSLISYAATWEGTDDFSSGISGSRWQISQQAHGQMIVQGANGHASFLVSASTTNEQNAYIVWQGHLTAAEDWTVQIKGHNSAPFSSQGGSQLALEVVDTASLNSVLEGYEVSRDNSPSYGSVFGTADSTIRRASVSSTATNFELRLVYHSATRQIEAWYDPTATGSDWTKLDTISLSDFSPSMTATDTFTFGIFSDTYYGPISEGEIWADDFQLTGEANGWLWAKRVASTINPDTELAIGMALDKQDNCYVTGWFDGTNDFGGVTLTNSGSSGGQDIFVAKYNSVGALQWARRAGGSSANWDVGRGVGLDTNGNVYVTGGYQGPANFGGTNLAATSGEEFFLAKYDSTGTVQWVQTSTGGSDDNYGVGLAVDSAGDSYALVNMDHSGTSLTFGSKTASTIKGGHTLLILVKYNNAGVAQWAQLFDSTEETYGSKLAVDAAGNVYVRGTFESDMTIGASNLTVSAGSTRNMFLAKFDSTGALSRVEHPIGGNVDEGGVAVDPAGNVYVSGWFATNLNFGAGISLTNTGAFDAFLAKYNSSGGIQWARQAKGANSAMVNGAVYNGLYWDVALDKQGNPYAAGLLSGTNGSGVAVIAKYSPDGTPEWTNAAVAPPGNPLASLAAKCVVDSAGNCYLAGWYQGTATFGANVLQPQGTWNYFLAKLAPSVTPTPALQFTASSTNGDTPLLVQFSSPSTDSSGHSIVSWNWNFGDGTTSTSQNPSHTYTDTGTFTPTLVATNDNELAVIGNGPQIEVHTPFTDFTYTANNGTITITGYTGSGGNVSIPSTINGYPVAAIGGYAFNNQTNLTGVTIPDSVASIGDHAFEYCSNLTSVAIPDSVIRIGYSVFDDCYSLTNVTIGNSVTGIPDYAFSACHVLTSVTIGNSVTYIGPYAFYHCYSLTSVTTPDTVTSIGDEAFDECFDLTYIAIPNSVTYIGPYAFYHCYSLTNATIGSSVASIGDYAFFNCSGLTSVMIPDSVTSIGDHAFGGCYGLTSVTISDRVTSIGSGVFEHCGLTSVTIPSSVTSIGDYAFYACPGLTNVTIPNNVTNMGTYAFSYCTNMHQAYFQGNAPSSSADNTVFYGESGTVYYVPGATGWGVTFGGWPTAQWYQPQPQILGTGHGLGAQGNRFQFTISWATNTAVVVEASTNLHDWTPVITNTLIAGTNAFADPTWTNYPQRFYRVRSQ